MKFVFFSVSENGENGLGDEEADGGNAPENFWLEPPLDLTSLTIHSRPEHETVYTTWKHFVCLQKQH